MAYTAVVSLINKLTRKLSEKEFLSHEVEDRVWSLLFMLKRLRPFVMDVQRKRSPEIVELMVELIESVNKADDAIDKYLTMRLPHSFIMLTTSEIQKAVNQLISDIDEIKRKLKKWHKLCFISTASSSVFEEKNYRVIIAQEDEINNDQLVTMMMERVNNKDPRRDVIPIVGPEGIGKTTLARRVYNDPTIVKNFPCRAWIYAYDDSCQFSMRNILQGIINQEDQFSHLHPHRGAVEEDNDDHHREKMNLKDLAIQAYKHLKNNRYLLVFDDVFRTQFWADINIIFPDNKSGVGGGGGGRIIFTTRYDEVALYARPKRPPFYMPPPLNEEESWKLFRDKASASTSTSTSQGPLVESQWKELVEACGGLPLAIVELAAQHQQEIFPKRIWELIYNFLPHHLKPCLLYMGVLKSCSSTQFKELIIAEGLVQPLTGAKKDYDIIAQEYLDELIKRNLVKVKSKSWVGSIKDIFISNELLLMNFCREKAREENFLDFVELGPLGSSPRVPNRIAVERWTGNYQQFFHQDTHKKARSVLILKDTNSTSERKFDREDWDSLLQTDSPLRVLDMDVDLIHTIPDEIVRLIYLRYLRLIFCDLEVILQPSICNLWNLEFLRVKNNKSRWLPMEFWTMRKLSSLSSSGVLHLPQPPEYLHGGSHRRGTGGSDSGNIVLDKLKRLKYVSVQSCTEDILSRMPNLVRLGVEGDIQHTNETKSLLGWDMLLSSVTHLSLKRTRLVGDPMKILGKLPNLQVLKLAFKAVEGDELNVCVTADGEVLLPWLKCMKLENMEIRRWNLSVGSMPNLEIIVIRNCCALEGLPSEALQKISTLRELEVYNYSHEAVQKGAIMIQEYIGRDRLHLRLETKSA